MQDPKSIIYFIIPVSAFFVVFIPVLAFIVFFIVKREVKTSEKNMDQNHFEVRQSKIVLVIGIICAVFFSGLIVWMTMIPNDTVNRLVYIFFSLFVILGLFLAVYCAVWKVKIDGSQIIYRQFTGIKKKFAFTDITKVKMKNQQQIKVYAKDKVIFKVDWNCKGFNVLVERLRNEQIPFENN